MMHITEDTPPDMLAGAMDLSVHLPSGKAVKMSVERRTPMMDVLVQITTSHQLNLSGYLIEALAMAPSSGHSEKVLPYKPNTPIGTLDTQHIRVIPKGRSLPAPRNVPPGHKPFESTFRLKVHLPRNQLFVHRVSMNILLEEVMKMVAEQKNLDPLKYEFRHPANLNEVLDPKLTLSDYQITEVHVVSKGSARLAPAFSASDIMALRKEEDRKSKSTGGGGIFNIFKRGKTSNGSGSLSSENRSISPTHSDDSRSVTPPAIQQIMKANNQLQEKPKAPQRKRRPAPKPPQITEDVKSETQNAKSENNNNNNNNNGLTICHSRNSSDSSGYHEASILSDNANTSLPRRPQTMIITESVKLNGEHSRSTGNLSKMSAQSKSTSSLAFAGRKKKAPPPPPGLKSASSVTNLERASPIVASPVEVQEFVGSSDICQANVKSSYNATNSPPESIASSLATTLSSNIETDINLSKESSVIIENEPKIDEKPKAVFTPIALEPAQEPDELDSWHYQLPPPPTGFRDDSPVAENLADTENLPTDSVVTSPELFEKLNNIKDAQSEVAPSEVPSAISEEEKLMYNKLSLENLEKRKSLVYNRELATSLKYDEAVAKGQTESISSKRSSVMSELEDVISNTTSKASTLSRSTSKVDNFKYSAADSHLPNFKISTYDNPKKKFNIFEDDSVVSNSENVVTQRRSSAEAGNTHNKNVEETAKSYRRSSSNEDTFKKPQEMNRYRVKTLQRACTTDNSIGRSESFSTSWVRANPVKRSKSQVALNHYKEDAPRAVEENGLAKSNSLFDVSGLQSLEIMRIIQTKLKTPNNSDETLDKNKTEAKPTPKETPQLPEQQPIVPKKIEAEKPAVPEKSTTPKVYQYQGPPSINLGTWSERPKTFVSVKDDKDYKFNTTNPPKFNVTINDALAEPMNVSIKINGSEPISAQSGGNVVIKIGSNEKPKDDATSRIISQTTAVAYRKPLGNVNTVERSPRPHTVAYDTQSFDISRVPIVRSVELKKPFKDMHISNTTITQICPSNEETNQYKESKSLNFVNNNNNVYVNTEAKNPPSRLNSISQKVPVVRGFSVDTGAKSWSSYNKTLPSRGAEKSEPEYITNKNVPFSQVTLRRTDSSKTNQPVVNNFFGNIVLRNTSNSFSKTNRYSTGNLNPNVINNNTINLNNDKIPAAPSMSKFTQAARNSELNGNQRDTLLSDIRNFGGKKGLKSRV